MLRVKLLRYSGLMMTFGSVIAFLCVYFTFGHWVNSLSILIATFTSGLTLINTSYAIQSNLKDTK